jgi:uncharacterized protein involved in exopolysaccharide biosynthesis
MNKEEKIKQEIVRLQKLYNANKTGVDDSNKNLIKEIRQLQGQLKNCK